MADSNVFNLNKPELNDPLQEILQEGARKIIGDGDCIESNSYNHCLRPLQNPVSKKEP